MTDIKIPQEHEYTYFVLLQHGDLEFLVEWHSKKPIETDEEIQHQKYWYEEHTCPTNWLDNVIEIWYKGERDPHGAFRFKNIVAAPKNWDAMTHQEREELLDLKELGLK